MRHRVALCTTEVRWDIPPHRTAKAQQPSCVNLCRAPIEKVRYESEIQVAHLLPLPTERPLPRGVNDIVVSPDRLLTAFHGVPTSHLACPGAPPGATARRRLPSTGSGPSEVIAAACVASWPLAVVQTCPLSSAPGLCPGSEAEF